MPNEVRPWADRAPLRRSPPAAPRFKVLGDNLVPVLSRWTVGSAFAALDAHAGGQFNLSGQLAEDMLTDDAIDSASRTRAMGLTSREIEIVPPSHGGSAAAECRDAIAENWDSICPEESVSDLIVSGEMMGFRACQVIWQYVDGVYMPLIYPWHPSLAYYDFSSRSYKAITASGPVDIVPGDGQWLLYTPHSPYRGWMRGLIRSTAIAYLSRAYAWRDWNRYNEVHGLPIRLVKVPAQTDHDSKESLELQVASLQNETTITLPQSVNANGDPVAGYDLSMIEAKADTWEAFQGLMSMAQERVAISWLGQNLTTAVDGGSLAAANTHDRVRLDYSQSDEKKVSACIKRDILAPFARFNFGSEKLAPAPRWKVEAKPDRTEQAAYLTAVGGMIAQMAQAGAPVDVSAMLREAGVPVSEDGQARLRPPQEQPQSFSLERPTSRPQRFVDAVTSEATRAAESSMAPLFRLIRKAATSSANYNELRSKVLEIGRNTDPSELATIIERSLRVANLAGRHAADAETNG